MAKWLHVYSEADVTSLTSTRANEQRFWQALTFLDSSSQLESALKDAAAFGIKYVLLGINEDFGPKANCGKGGATLGWQAFLQRFLNLPCNDFLTPNNVLLLGEIDCDDLQQLSDQLDNANPEQLTALRNLCEQLDERVSQVLAMVFAAGLEPIIIGGGHNNCYGILKALSQTSGMPCNAINFDPHADFRALEGRHSGNGFHYAYDQSFLGDYHVVGLHEQKNNQAIVTALKQARFSFTSYQEIQVSREYSLTKACEIGLQRFANKAPLGIEVDVDSISYMPVSAFTNCGFSVSDAEHFVYLGAKQESSRYLHLCEAAPANHPQGLPQGMLESGQVLSALVCSYLRGKVD
ncbi:MULTISPECIES: formimidoylglutamase [Pseudoalteromonas]|uniref:Arginase n=1 Tax=Pseudoalteromonas amylolytica TaxID=1859457 RepID=A0A1S1MSP1_9GAMM|nr:MULTISPECIES: formimidoylglutamase [Pseudoalteromonas]MCF6435468.1 formimidoylglutamase [Pseudoalteromonas sp. MMG022]OHU86369.1 arginase [Pseudoalteromonas sp. JW3]OHU89526.1 arginase [Pseudoalteromonas amylolytica]